MYVSMLFHKSQSCFSLTAFQHSVEVENALYADDRLMDAAAVSVPDRRLGELVAAVVTTKPAFHGQVTGESVIENARRL